MFGTSTVNFVADTLQDKMLAFSPRYPEEENIKLQPYHGRQEEKQACPGVEEGVGGCEQRIDWHNTTPAQERGAARHDAAPIFRSTAGARGGCLGARLPDEAACYLRNLF